MLHSHQVPADQTALLVIDVQDSFHVGPRWARRNNLDFERNVEALVASFRAAGRPVIYFLHTDGDEGFATDSPYFRLMGCLAPRPGEPVLVKTTRNAFTSTPLGAMLTELGVRRVVICGIQMEQCCETTARVAADLGYAVDFVTEATLTFPIPHRDDPTRELGVEAIRERTEYALRGRFARLATVAEIARELASAVPALPSSPPVTEEAVVSRAG